MKLQHFFESHPVFTLAEFSDYLQNKGQHNIRTQRSLLGYYQKQGRIQRIQKELYQTIPLGQDFSYPSDPYLIVAKLDCVVAYHTALEFHGIGYSIFNEVQCLSPKVRPLKTLRGNLFRFIRYPQSLIHQNKESIGINTHERQGISIRVTSLERTVVDVLDRIDISGGIEEVWRSLSTIQYFNIDGAIEYALLLENHTTIGKFGYFLSENKNRLMATEIHLKRLEKYRPKEPHYWVQKNRGGKLISRWNLIIPENLVTQNWEEPLEIDE